MSSARHPQLIALGARIRELREATGLSQEAFAAAVGLDRTYYGGIERGERNVAGLNLIRIALVLKVEVGALFPALQQVAEGERDGRLPCLAGGPAARLGSPNREVRDMEKIATLEMVAGFEEELVYVIECFMEDLTGEAKSELNGLIGRIASAEGLAPGWRESLVGGLEPPLRELMGDNYDGAARAALVTVRRRLANTRRVLQGLPQLYGYADPLS